LVFAAVTVVLGAQGMSLRNALQWLFYLVLFVATDQIAEAIMNRLGRGHGEDTSAANKETNSSESR